MSTKLLGKKLGMTQLFNKEGSLVPCSVIFIEPNVITGIKNEERDGYKAVQIGSLAKKKKKIPKPQKSFFEKQSLPCCKELIEFKGENNNELQVGSKLGVEVFSDEAFVDIAGVSKGKGYQGVMKLHGFAGGPSSHGSGFHRHAGSTGMRTDPGRCLPGGKRASQMGRDKVTVQNMKVVSVDESKGLLFIQGAIPGAKGSLVQIRKAIKKRGKGQ